MMLLTRFDPAIPLLWATSLVQSSALNKGTTEPVRWTAFDTVQIEKNLANRHHKADLIKDRRRT
jgi:hypothetical protein